MPPYSSEPPAVVSATKETARRVTFGERLFQFAVNDNGVMVAVYNSDQSCVIKIKSVAQSVDEDWHFLIHSTVASARPWFSQCWQNQK